MKKLLLGVALWATFGAAMAQTNEANQRFTPNHGALLDGRTMVKTNLMGYALGSYSISLERILTKNLSVQVGFSKRPEKSVGFGLDKISKEFEDSKLGSQSFSVDLRWYLSRTGYGHGFYLQPYFRHENHSVKGLEFGSSSSDALVKDAHSYSVSGSLKSNSVGLSVGAQWLIGKKKNILIDWTILGVHYGWSGKTELIGTYKGELKEEALKAKEDYKKDVENFISDLPFVKGQVNFDESKDGLTIKTQLTHPYVFLRGGLSVGFRF